MKPYLAIATLDEAYKGVNGERFAVIAIDPSKRVDGGCKCVVQSLHHTEIEAADAIEEAGHG